MNKIYSKIATIIMLGSIIATPSFAFADSNKGKGNKFEVKIEKREREREREHKEDDDKKCYKAYGHLISFGWLKKNKEIEIEGDCYLPFGISKKFKGNATTTDTTAPIISNISATTTPVKAVITWNTDERSDSTVFWSTGNVDVNSSSTPRTYDDDRVLNHKVAIKNLVANTTYNAIIRSKDRAGNTVYSSQFSFTTKSPIVTPDTTSPTIFSVVAVVGTSTANIGWQTNEPGTSKVYYSTSTPLSLTASSTNFVENTGLKTAHLLNLVGLSTSTKYYLVVESKDAAGNTQRSSEFNITTSN